MLRKFLNRRQGFTIIEILVAIAILAILASIVTISFNVTRRNSRDSRRKADVQTIASAMSQYTVVAGTTFVKLSGQTCVLPDEKDPSLVPNFTANPGCVGASGRSFGKMNLVDATSSGYATNPGRLYAPSSIGAALEGAGYLSNMPRDPLSDSNQVLTADNPDYVLIRACVVTGKQQVGRRGTVFAVWAGLENGPTDQEKSNSDRYPGGKDAGPVGGGSDYIYDFAAQLTDWQTGVFYLRGFAVGNGITKIVSNDTCAQGPEAA